MASRHKSIRVDPEMQRLITARCIAENCDETAAIRSLIQDERNKRWREIKGGRHLYLNDTKIPRSLLRLG